MASNEEILAELRQVSTEQARVAAELKAHTELDTERFKTVNEKLDGIGKWSHETRQDVKSLLLTREFQKGVRWASVKAASWAAVCISAAVSGGFALLVWLLPMIGRGGK
jgi:hypothetical protein